MWQEIGEDLRQQHPRLALKPCEACPLYRLPDLHPITIDAIRITELLDGGESGREIYRITPFVYSEEEFNHFFLPIFQHWKSIVGAREKAAREKARKQAEIKDSVVSE